MSERPTNLEFPKREMPKQEIELTPEILEIVLKKVQDIHADGTAYTGINPGATTERDIEQLLSSIFKNGVLGGQPGTPRDKDNWTQELKNKGRGPKAAPVFFNIVGRSVETGHGGRPNYDGIRILFDLAKFHEVGLPLKKDYGEGEDRLDPKDSPGYEAVLDPYTFWVTQPGDVRKGMEKDFSEMGIPPEDMVEAWQPGSEALKALSKKYPNSFTPEGLIRPNAEYGFVLAYRIAPRLFRGLVVRDEKKELEVIKSTLLEVYKDQPNLLIPIYDRTGTLLWPKRMSRMEILQKKEK